MTFSQTFLREMKGILKKPGMLIILFIGPIFLTMFFGGVYLNDYVNNIPIAILDEDGSSLSRMMIDQFDSNERFSVSNYPRTRGDLKKLIDDGHVHMGLWIPDGFEHGATTYESAEILILTDGTNLVVANNAYAQAATIIQTISAGVELKLIEGKGIEPDKAMKLAVPFGISERVLFDSKMTYMNYLIVCFVAVFFQQLYMAGMGSILHRHSNELAQGSILSNVMATASAMIVCFIPSALICYGILKHLFHVPINGRILTIALMTLIFLISLTGPALILCSLVKDRVSFSQVSLMLSLPTFVTSGCVWPVEQMPILLTVFIKLAWPLINYAKFIQEILIKGREIGSVSTNILQMIVYAAVYITIGVYMYRRRFSSNDEESVLVTT